MNYITKNFDNDLIDCSITSNYDEEYINIYPTLKEQELLYLACKYPRNPGCCDVKSKIIKKFSLPNVLLGNGSEDLIVRLNQIFSQHNYKIGVVYPIFYRIIETISNDIYYIKDPE